MPEHEATGVAVVSVSARHAPTVLSAYTARAWGQPSDQSTSAATPSSGQYTLMGVIASAAGQGSALIASNGQPPKAYLVGQVVQDGLTLVALTSWQARLKSDHAEILLEFPTADKR